MNMTSVNKYEKEGISATGNNLRKDKRLNSIGLVQWVEGRLL